MFKNKKIVHIVAVDENRNGFIKEQANKFKSQIDPRAYEALMNYAVEITD